jgi:branched-chain amino acid transport system ATP-binding protein
MNAVVLQAQGLVKRFDGILATDHVDLALPQGERHALIGPNGAGKTTLVNLLTGVLKPTEGRIELLGQDISRLSVHQRVRRGLVRTFQISQLFPSKTPLQTLAMTVSQQRGLARQWWTPLGHDASVLQRCEVLLDLFNLTAVMHQDTRSLPYGKRRLLEMAIALACEPKVLLLDEPMAGVPAAERAELMQTLSTLPEDVTVLLIEHDMDLVFEFAQRITVLVHGAVLVQGTPSEIARNEQVKAVYLGNQGTHA